MANPRKFSEKIALHNQKQAEETAEFERVMQECTVTRVMGAPQPRNVAYLQPHPQAFLRPYLSGSLPNVNQIAANPQMELHHQPGFDEGKHLIRHSARFDSRPRPYAYANRRPNMPLELGRRIAQMDGQHGQYPSTYLSPPPETNWRSFALSRTNSDSALHQSVMNPQEQFNPSNPTHHQARTGVNEGGYNSMSPSYKAMIESNRFDQQLQNAHRSKSSEAPSMSLMGTAAAGGDSAPVMHGSGDITNVPLGGANAARPINQSLSHVAQIGNNTGSLPNLPALFNHPQGPNPRDFSEQATSHAMPSSNPPLYHQTQSSSNLPSASALSHRLGGPSRNPASPGRMRRTTFNGPSPLSISSPEHSRRMKFPSTTSPKVGVKPELKSPPIGGPYSNPYPGPPGGWRMQADHPGSPSHAQTMSPRSLSQQGSNSSIQQQQQHMPHHAGAPLRIDVSAASKISQQPPHSYSRGGHGAPVTSPLTSPTSPTSHCSQLSPVTSPRTDFTAGTNHSHTDQYYRSDLSSIQPLQHQFEQFHVVNDSGPPSHTSRPPPMYSTALASLKENSLDGIYEHGHSGTMAHTIPPPLHSAPAKLGQASNHVNNIPHITFTGVDEHHVKTGSILDGSDLTQHDMMSHDLSSVDYFGDAEELKTNIGIEELRMLDQTNIITDPVMEDNLHLDNL